MTAEKTRYSDSELAEFKALIQQKLDDAQNQLNSYLEQMAHIGENDKVKGIDDAVGSAESERLSNMAGRQKKHIQHLKNALLRIENKVYGICRSTGKLIAKERLFAVPHATLSIAAKQDTIKRR